jgi:outer membrane protein TolC
VLGFTPADLAPQYSVAATLSIPIFQGGKIRADVQQAEAVLKQRQAQVDNLKGAIEQDVQDALLDLKAAAQQVEVASSNLDLAKQTVAQSQDRFAAGVTNNVEVIQAQQQLATANDQYIASLYEHNIAKVLLARAIGNAEQLAKQYLADNGSTTALPNVNQSPAMQNPNTTVAPSPQAPETPRP